MVQVVQLPPTPAHALLSGAAQGIQQGFQQQQMNQVLQQSQGMDPQQQINLVLGSNLPQAVKQQMIANLQYQQGVGLQQQRLDEQVADRQLRREAFKEDLLQKRSIREANQKLAEDLAAMFDRVESGEIQATAEEVKETQKTAEQMNLASKGQMTTANTNKLRRRILLDPLADQQMKLNALAALDTYGTRSQLTEAESAALYQQLRDRGLDKEDAAIQAVAFGAPVKVIKDIAELSGEGAKNLTIVQKFNLIKQKYESAKKALLKPFEQRDTFGNITFDLNNEKGQKAIEAAGKLDKAYFMTFQKLSNESGLDFDVEAELQAIQAQREILGMPPLEMDIPRQRQGSGKKATPEQIQEFIDRAGGNLEEAYKLAKEAGFSF